MLNGIPLRATGRGLPWLLRSETGETPSVSFEAKEEAERYVKKVLDYILEGMIQ